jgi:hypothetical protein
MFKELLFVEALLALRPLEIVRPQGPKEHLIPVFVQNPQALGVLRHVQSAYIEERPSFHLGAFQIRCDVRNTGEPGVRVVLFASAEELNRKDHSAASLCAWCGVSDRVYPTRVDASGYELISMGCLALSFGGHFIFCTFHLA